MLARGMTSRRLAALWMLPCLLAGCAAPRGTSPAPAAAPKGVYYSAKILALRPIAPDAATDQAVNRVVQALGGGAPAVPAEAQEIVVQLADGSVKTLVPPPGAAPAHLATGEMVAITESPTLQIAPR